MNLLSFFIGRSWIILRDLYPSYLSTNIISSYWSYWTDESGDENFVFSQRDGPSQVQLPIRRAAKKTVPKCYICSKGFMMKKKLHLQCRICSDYVHKRHLENYSTPFTCVRCLRPSTAAAAERSSARSRAESIPSAGGERGSPSAGGGVWLQHFGTTMMSSMPGSNRWVLREEKILLPMGIAQSGQFSISTTSEHLQMNHSSREMKLFLPDNLWSWKLESP